MSLLPTADEDVAQAVVAKWAADKQQLPTLVPGILQRGRLSPFLPNTDPPVRRPLPYAGFEVVKGADGLHQTPGAIGSFYLDSRYVTISIRGLKADVEAALEYIRAAKMFNRATLPTQATFTGCRQAEHTDLEEDPEKRAGEDIWIGTIYLEVFTTRPE